METLKQLNDKDYKNLIDDIGALISNAHQKIAASVNSLMVETYWHIGKYIVEYEQNGNQRAEYGSGLLTKLSKDLTLRYGKGYSLSNINKMRKLYLTHQILQTVSAKLSWSHYVEILKLDNPLEISFYAKETENAQWSVRELKRQMNSMLFHRLATGKDKEAILQLATKGNEIQKPEDIIRDPYVIEFVNLPDLPHYKESDLENSLVENLGRFMLELGKGFAYIGRQYRITLGGRHMYIDLVFYNVILKCYVLIDLKRDEIHHEDIGQMNLYINYFKNEVCTDGDNEPVGIVLGARHDGITMQYALQGISNQLFVSRYQMYLPDRETLERELLKLL